MFRAFARLLLLRILPRRLVPLLTAYEVFRFVQGRRRAGQIRQARRVGGTPAVDLAGNPSVGPVVSPVVGPEGRARVG